MPKQIESSQRGPLTHDHIHTPDSNKETKRNLPNNKDNELTHTLKDLERRRDGSKSKAIAYDFSAASNWSIAIKASPWQI